MLVFAVLLLGPPLASLFQVTELPVLADSGALARGLLSRYVCPTPAKSYVLLAFPMAVCARCWGATIGLWVAWLLVRRPAVPLLLRYLLLPLAPRLFVSALPFLLWVAEIRWWAAAASWLLLLNGAQAGFSAGAFLCSVWPGKFARMIGDRRR